MWLNILWPIIIIFLASPPSMINRLINRIEIIMTVLESRIIFLLPLLVILLLGVGILLVIRRPVIKLLAAPSTPVKLLRGIHKFFLRNSSVVAVMAALTLAMAMLLTNLLLSLFFILFLIIFVFLLEVFFLLFKIFFLLAFLMITLLFFILLFWLIEFNFLLFFTFIAVRFFLFFCFLFWLFLGILWLIFYLVLGFILLCRFSAYLGCCSTSKCSSFGPPRGRWTV